jgi:hypothetical protein
MLALPLTLASQLASADLEEVHESQRKFHSETLIVVWPVSTDEL